MDDSLKGYSLEKVEEDFEVEIFNYQDLTTNETKHILRDLVGKVKNEIVMVRTRQKLKRFDLKVTIALTSRR
ncbi:hypothetical protein CGI80_13545 [Vibrio parahaemolyticus]|nr:hypothetical protein CGI80_13545 [Vibrio parahaemolyticus]